MTRYTGNIVAPMMKYSICSSCFGSCRGNSSSRDVDNVKTVSVSYTIPVSPPCVVKAPALASAATDAMKTKTTILKDADGTSVPSISLEYMIQQQIKRMKLSEPYVMESSRLPAQFTSEATTNEAFMREKIREIMKLLYVPKPLEHHMEISYVPHRALSVRDHGSVDKSMGYNSHKARRIHREKYKEQHEEVTIADTIGLSPCAAPSSEEERPDDDKSVACYWDQILVKPTNPGQILDVARHCMKLRDAEMATIQKKAKTKKSRMKKGWWTRKITSCVVQVKKLFMKNSVSGGRQSNGAIDTSFRGVRYDEAS